MDPRLFIQAKTLLVGGGVAINRAATSNPKALEPKNFKTENP